MSAQPPTAKVGYPFATQQDTMAETVAIDPPPVAESATVSASALALHLDCSRAYLGKLEVEDVIQRQGDGFLLDQSRIAYLRYLRRERRQSPRSEADAEHAFANAALLRFRVEEKQRNLVPRDLYDAMIDENGWPCVDQAQRLACAGSWHGPCRATAGRSRAARAAHRDSERVR